uniref:Putative ovule protein n=1 Tax=Solanum chacoense TaxID=4108 RepID=A0A0V0GNF2_SOLCH
MLPTSNCLFYTPAYKYSYPSSFFIFWISLPISSSAIFALLSPFFRPALFSSFLSSTSDVPLFPLFWLQPCFFFSS